MRASFAAYGAQQEHRRRPLPVVGVVGILCLVLILSSGALTPAPTDAEQTGNRSALSAYPEYSLNWRVGYGVARENGYVSEYDVSSLAAGWYHDWGILENPPRPSDMEFVQHVRVSQAVFNLDNPSSYNWSGLENAINANPGAVWVIGNEPDGRVASACDTRSPLEYAQVYKTFYDFIKGVDSTARVANGPIIQPTTIRLTWLTKVWDHYNDLYGVDMPVDVWTMHNQIVVEAYRQGAEYPLDDDGSDLGREPTDLGAKYGTRDNDNMTIFANHVVAMRQWMYDHGQRSKPLYLTEYGVLQPEYEGFTQDRINEYMDRSFTYLLFATHGTLGYPADSNHLVQRWNWFALNVPTGRLGQEGAWNGSLFDPDTYEITEVGLNFERWMSRSVQPTPTPAANGYSSIIYREAERGSVHGSMARVSDSTASDCRCITVPLASSSLSTDEGADATYSVYIPDTGEYRVWGRGKGVDYANKSFNLKVSYYDWQSWGDWGAGGWAWKPASGVGGSGTFHLEGGQYHTIMVGPRVGGQTKLDALIVTTDSGYNPNNDSSIFVACNPTPNATATPTYTPSATPSPTITRTPMPTGPARIIGSVTYQGRGTSPSSAWEGELQVSAHLPDDPIPAYLFSVASDQSGNFEVPTGILTGTYDIGVRDPHSLRNMWADISVSSSTGALDMGTLIEGDATSDNVINILDFSMLAGGYGLSQGDAGFRSQTDFNDDGTVNVLDFSILATNYGRQGSVMLSSAALAELLGDMAATGTVSVYVSPSSTTVAVGESFTIDVYVNAGANIVNTAEVPLAFNPTYLEVLSMTAGPALELVLTSTYDNGAGTVSYVAGTSSPQTGLVKLYTLSMRAKAATASTTLSLGNVRVIAPGAAEHTVNKQNGTVLVPAATITPTPSDTPVMTVVPTPTRTPTPGPDVQELILQEGVDGYDGFDDTYISAWEETTNYVSDPHLKVRSPGIWRTLIRADVTMLDPGTEIVEAVLTLHQATGSRNPVMSSMYEVITPWEGDQATWLRAYAGVSWGVAGCDGAGSDRASAPFLEQMIFPTYGSYLDYPFDYDVTSLVQQWVSDPGSNYGLQLASTVASAIGYEFRSSDYVVVAARPRLLIRYRTGGTLTPTPDGSATVTPTPTQTVESGGAIGGRAFEDLDADRVLDAGEPGVPGTVLELRKVNNVSFYRTETSDAQGDYRFGGLEAGTYRLVVIGEPLGYRWMDKTPLFIAVDETSEEDVPIALERVTAMSLPLVFRASN